MKNTIRISFFAVIIVVFGWLFYYIFTQKFPETTISDIENILPISKIGGLLPGEEEIKNKSGDEAKNDVAFPSDSLISKISNAEVFDYSVISDNEIYYFTGDGRVFQAKASGDEIVSEEKKESLNSISLSPNHKRAFVSSGNPRNPTWNIYDFLDKSWRPISKNIKTISWGVNEDEAYALSDEDGSPAIVRISLLNNNLKTSIVVKNFYLSDSFIVYGDASKVLISEKPSALYKGSLYELSLKNLIIKKVITEESGLIIKMINSSLGFKSSSEQNLSFINSGGVITKDLSLKTIPQKCTFLNDTAFCFVFVDLPNNILLPDDYFKNKFNSVDDVYSINIKTGEQKILAATGEGELPPIDGVRPTATEKYLYFINRYDGALYRLNLGMLSETKNDQTPAQ